MCSLAPSAPLGLDSTAFLDRRRGVAAVAPAACGVMAREPVRRRVGAVVSSAPTNKRPRDGFDGNIREREGLDAGKVSVVRAQGQQRLQERMRVELDAIRVLHRKAVLLCRGAGRSDRAPGAKDGARFSVAGARSEAAMQQAAKRRKTTPSNPAPEAKKQSTEPVKKQQQQQRPVQQRATPAPTKGPVAKAVDKAREIEKKRRLEVVQFVKIFPGAAHGWAVRYSNMAADLLSGLRNAEEALQDTTLI